MYEQGVGGLGKHFEVVCLRVQGEGDEGAGLQLCNIVQGTLAPSPFITLMLTHVIVSLGGEKGGTTIYADIEPASGEEGGGSNKNDNRWSDGCQVIREK